MGPVPHTIRSVMESLEKTTSPDQCNEKIVNGRLMEAQGKMLQYGVTNTMAINMTYREYLKRMNMEVPERNKSPSRAAKTSLTPEMKEAATKELVQKLKETAMGQASKEAVELVEKAAESMASTRGHLKIEKKPSTEKETEMAVQDTHMREWSMAEDAVSVSSSAPPEAQG